MIFLESVNKSFCTQMGGENINAKLILTSFYNVNIFISVEIKLVTCNTETKMLSRGHINRTF